MWQQHYYGCLNSSKDYNKKQYVLHSIGNLTPSDSVQRITAEEIRCAIKAMKRGKSCGNDSINSEHLLFCDNKIDVILAMIFNTMIIHLYLPEEFMLTLIIPLLKDKKGDVTSKCNYKPIAITSMLSKVLELIFL